MWKQLEVPIKLFLLSSMNVALIFKLSVSKLVSDLYSAKISEENQGALGMGDKGQGRLTESSGLLNDV